MEKMNTCPHCGKTNCVMYLVYMNAESYGSHVYHVPCIHCNKMLRVGAQVVVEIYMIEKSDKPLSDSDFQLQSLDI